MYNMNQRRDSRWAADMSACVTVFGSVDRLILGKVRNVSSRGIGLSVDTPIPPGAALKIEIADSMLLGEVIYCRADGESYYTGIELEQVLHGLLELSQTLRQFSGDSGSQQADPVHYAHGENQKQPH